MGLIASTSTKDSPDLVQELYTVKTSLIRDLLMRFSRGESVTNVVSTSTAENNDIQQGVSAETVGTMH